MFNVPANPTSRRLPGWLRFGLIGAAGLAGLGLVGALALPAIVDAEQFRGQVEQTLTDTLNRRVELGRLRLQTLGGLGLRADRVQVASRTGGSRDLDVASALVEVDLWALLGQKLAIRRLDLEGVNLRLVRDKAGRWNIADLLDRPQDPSALGYTGPALRLTDSTVQVTDLSRGAKRELELRDVALDLTPRDPFTLVVDLQGKLKGGESLAVDGTLNAPRTSPGEAWGGEVHLVTGGLPAERVVALIEQPALAGLRGALDADLRWKLGAEPTIAGSLAARNLDWRWAEVFGASPWRAQTLTIDLDLTLGKALTQLRKLTLVADGTRIEATGTVPRYFNRPGRIDLALRAPSFDPFKARSSLPVGVLPANLRRWLSEARGQGTVDADVRLVGAVAAPALDGRLRFDGLSLTHPTLGQPLEDFRGTLAFQGSRLSLDGLKGRFGRSGFTLAGTVDDYRSQSPRPDLALASSSLDLGAAFALAAPSLPPLKANIAAVEGTAAVDLRLTGRTLRGSAEFQGAKLRPTALKQPLEDLRGRLVLDPALSRAEGLSARLAGSTLALTGSLANDGRLQARGEGSLAFPAVLALLPAGSPLKAKGEAPLRFTASGSTQKLAFDLGLDLSKLTELQVNALALTPARRLDLRGTYSPGALTLADTRLALGGLELAAGGSLLRPGAPESTYNLAVRTVRPLDLATVRRLVPATARLGATAGTVNLQASLKGAARSPAVGVNLALRGVALPGLIGGIKDLNGTVALDNKRATSPGLSFLTREGPGQLKGSVENFDDPRFQFDARFARLDLDRLIAEASANRDDGGNDLRTLRGQGRLAIGQGVLSRLEFQNLQTGIHLERGVLSLDGFQMQTGGGRMGGDLRTNLETRTVQGRLAIAGVEANTLATRLINFPGGQIYGATDLQVEFAAQSSSPEAFLTSLDGRGFLNVRDGRLATLNLMGPILGVADDLGSGRGVNVGSLIGAVGRLNTGRFSRLGGAFTIENGVARTNDFSYLGQGLTMHSAGTLRLIDRNADLAVNGQFSNALGGGDTARQITGILFNLLKVPQAQPRNFSFEVHGPINRVTSVRGVQLR